MAQTRTATRTNDAREARIGAGTRVRGRVHGEGDLVVEGAVEGDVSIQGDLTIGEGADVSADTIEAHRITIAGTVAAQVQATGPVHLTAEARVRGTVRGPSLSMDDGARYSGRVECEFDLPSELGGSTSTDTRGRSPARR